MLYVRYPITSIFGRQLACDQQNDINNPPDATSTKRQQFSDGRTNVTQTESVNTGKPQQNGIQKCCQKIMICVLQAWESVPPESSITIAFDVGQGCTFG